MSTELVTTQQNTMQALVPRSITEAIALAEVLSKATLLPDHLKNKPGDCLLVIMQAQRWGMDALSVAQCTSVVRGKLCYEGKLVAAVLYSMGAIDGRIRYDFSGSGQGRKIVVTARARGAEQAQSVEGTVADWKTDNGSWSKIPDDMLVYRGNRQWARRYAPEALLGVYTPDELEGVEVTAGEFVADKPSLVDMPRSKSEQTAAAASEKKAEKRNAKSKQKPAPEPVQTDDTQDADSDEEEADEESSRFDLPEHALKTLRAAAKRAGLDDVNDVLKHWPAVNLGNINEVFDWLRNGAK